MPQTSSDSQGSSNVWVDQWGRWSGYRLKVSVNVLRCYCVTIKSGGQVDDSSEVSEIDRRRGKAGRTKVDM